MSLVNRFLKALLNITSNARSIYSRQSWQVQNQDCAKLIWKKLKPTLKDQYMYTINWTTSTRTIEDTWSRETALNLTATTFQLTNSATATLLSQLAICGTTRRLILKKKNWTIICQQFHVVSLLKVFSMTLMFWKRDPKSFPLSRLELHGHQISSTNSKILRTNQMENLGKTFSGSIWPMVSIFC